MDPILHYPNGQGQTAAEYIPIETTEISRWLRRQWLQLFAVFGWDVHWWHVRHMYMPETRKQIDMHFIRHVLEAHDGEPEDPQEARFYKRARSLYGAEYDWFQEAIKPTPVQFEDLKYKLPPHPYAVAYRKRWLGLSPDPEWTTLYHGLTLEDCKAVIYPYFY